MSTTKAESGKLLVTGRGSNDTWRSADRVYGKMPPAFKNDLENPVDPVTTAAREAAKESIHRGLGQVAEGRVVRLDAILDEE